MESPVLLLVADHGPGVGAGHLGRQLALAQAWVSGGGSAWVVDDPSMPAGWAARYERAGVEVIGTAVEERARHADIVSIDGYRFGPEVIARHRDRSRVLLVDDHGLSASHDVDWILDQNLPIDVSSYDDRSPECELLTGPGFALVRSEVLASRLDPARDRAKPPHTLLLALGGDPSRDLVDWADAVLDDPRLRHLEVLRLAGLADVGPVLAAADVALTAAGSTCWDLCVHGVPMVALAVSGNQEPIAPALAAAGVALDAGLLGVSDPNAAATQLAGLVADGAGRASMAKAGRALVDGHGGARVSTELRSGLIGLRRATMDDARVLWEWRNDPEVQASSFSSAPIAWDSHQSWLEQRLADERSLVLVADDHAGHPLGQFRVAVGDDGRGVIGLSIAADQRGRGWAAPLIRAGTRYALRRFASADLERLEARVLPSNARSSRAFTQAGFVLTHTDVDGSLTYHAGRDG